MTELFSGSIRVCKRSRAAINTALFCRYFSNDSSGVAERAAILCNTLFVSWESRMRVVAARPISATYNCSANIPRNDVRKRALAIFPHLRICRRASASCFHVCTASSRGISMVRRTSSYESSETISSRSAARGCSALGRAPTPRCSSKRSFARTAS